jgi:hypothetical protein
MPAYADPETLVAGWIHAETGIKVWADPVLPGNQRFTAAVAHLQRTPGSAPMALTLDDFIFDVDVYAENPDHARVGAGLIWTAITLKLPRHTFTNGLFVTGTSTVSPPYWGPSTSLARRSASYRAILHGLI